MIGGNDVQLLNLLNQCILQMGAFNAEQAAAAKVIVATDEQYAFAKDWDWDALSRGCEGQIYVTRAMARSATFQRSLDKVVSAARRKLAPG